MNEKEMEMSTTGLEIAVIGMTGRFPGARNIDEFWSNLIEARETIAFYGDEELKKNGVSSQLMNNPAYVNASGWLEDIEFFDSSFFGYTPLEAEIMDPQTRIFHECAHEALEDAGYDPFTYQKLIGLYAGAAPSFNWQALVELSGKNNIMGWFASRNFNDKDFLGTLIAHKLNLKGPALTLDTACSTSMVAIHLACQGLLSGDCDMALAGAVTVHALQKGGYLYQEGMIHSPDGHCRAFDANAEGSIFGNGAGIVVLKRLDDAVVDRDTIHAVIKGSFINNDGIRKATYTAPSVKGQAEVIRNAYKMAEVNPETIGYVETHGTGTSLGDPVEIEGLKSAFNTRKKQFCRIGSVKSNVGHLQNTAGVTGFIKAVLILKHQLIPPSLFFEKPNPKIDFANSPFIVNAQLTEWKAHQYPRRAGVSSFGIGGTNVHVILEEWTGAQSAMRTAQGKKTKEQGAWSQAREYQLILLSAKTETALGQMTQNLVNHFQEHPDIQLADAAYTLQVGRQVFPHRRMLVSPGNDIREAVNLLSTESRKLKTYKSEEDNRPIIFMFPGQNSQYVNMGRDLYQHETIFRQEMDRCFEILNGLVDYNIKEILYPDSSPQSAPSMQREDNYDKTYATSAASAVNLHQTEIAPLVIFIFEYALARLIMEWGIKPDSMIGYSLGEYTAACISGVFSLEDALKVMVIRGELIKGLPRGGMLSVPLAIEQLEPLLKEFHPALSIAIDNGPSCIVSGLENTVDAFAEKMKKKKLFCLRLNTSNGIHSRAMAPVLKEFEGALAGVALKAPQIPYISNVTGTWIKAEEAQDPSYWSTHLEKTVRFADGIHQLRQQPNTIFIEVGPGRDLCSLLANQPDNQLHQQAVNLVRPPQTNLSDLYYLLNKVGQLWLRGTYIDWWAFYQGQQRHRISLPTYPFEGQLYPVPRGDSQTQSQKPLPDALMVKKPDIADWFYYPSWMRSQLSLDPRQGSTEPRCWLVFAIENDFCSLLVQRLKQLGHKVITVIMGEEFKPQPEEVYTLNPGQENDYLRLLEALAQEEVPSHIVHTWSMARQGQEPGETVLKTETVENALITGFYSMIYLAKALGKQDISGEIQLQVITRQLQEVTGQEAILPQQAPLLGPLKVIPQEYPFIRCKNVDILLPESGSAAAVKLVNHLLVELTRETPETDIAYRNHYRWVKTFRPLRFRQVDHPITRLREKGVYLITGGMGRIGMTLANHLAQSLKARLILVGRSVFPGRDQWEQILSNAGNGDIIALKIRALKQMEARGGQVLTFCTDVTDQAGMEAVISQSEQRFGPINGVIHAAGDIRITNIQSIEKVTRSDCQRQFLPKIYGLLTLEKVLRGKKLDFCWLTSSLSPILGGLGFSAYSAANHFMDAFVKWKQHQHPGNPAYWISVNWADWEIDAGGKKSPVDSNSLEPGEMNREGWWMMPHEGIETFRRILSQCDAHQVVVSTVDLQTRLDRWVTMKSIREPQEEPSQKTTALYYRSRPQLETNYVKPASPIENAIAEVLQDFLGIEEVGTQDNFFELGATSLNIIQINTIARKKLQRDISVMWWFEHPTIKTLSGHLLEQTRENPGEEAVTRETEEKRALAVEKGKTRLEQLKKRVR